MKIATCIAAAAFSLMSVAAKAATLTTFETPHDGELITESLGDNVKRVVCSVDVGTLSVNDIIIVTAEAEGTAITPGDTFRVTSQLIRGSSSSDISGTPLDEATTTNCFPGIGHIVLTKHAVHTVTGSTGNHFVNFYVSTNDDMTVEQGYGRLQILVIHQ